MRDTKITLAEASPSWRYVRFLPPGKKEARAGILTGEEVQTVAGEISGEFSLSGEIYPLAAVTLLAPCRPSKIVAVGLNYRDHAAEMGQSLPAEPVLFLKPATAVIGPGGGIVYPNMSRQVDYEAELGVVIGRVTRGVTPEEAEACLWGYTCFNDVTARDLQRRDGQWTRAKSFDTFAPIGPWIVPRTALDPADLMVESYLNGQRCQSSRTSQLIFSVPDLVSFISRIMTLYPGDVIATGTPAGIGPMQVGDEIEIRVEGIGSLRNRVVAPPGHLKESCP